MRRIGTTSCVAVSHRWSRGRFARYSVSDPIRITSASGEFRDIDLFGSATARVAFAPHAVFPGAFNVERLTYDFEAAAGPAPEPASMLLLGTGLAGVAGCPASSREDELTSRGR